MIFDHVWFWKTRPLHADLSPMDRKGQSCAVLVRGGKNSVLVEFESDHYRVVTSRHAVRLKAPKPQMELL